MTNEPERWSSLEEIAEHLGVSKDTIRNWIKKEVIPYRRIGKQYKFKISEVDEWVESGKSAEIEWKYVIIQNKKNSVKILGALYKEAYNEYKRNSW